MWRVVFLNIVFGKKCLRKTHCSTHQQWLSFLFITYLLFVFIFNVLFITIIICFTYFVKPELAALAIGWSAFTKNTKKRFQIQYIQHLKSGAFACSALFNQVRALCTWDDLCYLTLCAYYDIQTQDLFIYL